MTAYQKIHFRLACQLVNCKLSSFSYRRIRQIWMLFASVASDQLMEGLGFMHCLIVDEHPVTLLGLRLLMKSNFSDWTISTAASIDHASAGFDVMKDQAVSLILLGLSSPDDGKISFLSNLRQDPLTESILSIVIASQASANDIDEYKRCGARGYVAKSSDTIDIIRAVKIICSGGEYFGAGKLGRSDNLLDGSVNLTSRQMDLVELLCAGYSNKMIAHALNLSYGTVKNYMFDLMRLMSVKSRLELVSRFRERI
jgi:two-component system nitrate/nitrite response regulator NarL